MWLKKHEWPGLGFDRYLAQSRDEEEPVYPNMARPAQEVALAFGRFLEGRTTEKPYFAQINFNETHTPFEFGGVTADRAKGVTVPGWIEKDGEAEQHFALLQGSVAALDRGIGILLEALEANGRANDTLIVFATDHGLEAVRDKWSCYESGLGIAAMLRYPAAGVTGGRRIREPVSNVDLLPTMLGLAGIDLPPDLDGLDLTTVVRGQQSADAERPIFGIYHNSGIRSVRVGNWKLIRNFSAEPYRELAPATLLKRKPLQPRPHAELYNLSEDPDELTNLIGSHPEQAALLERHLAVWMQQVKDPAYIC
ncbi:MAG: sulfatase-like hydrolase/transferase [Verrucomicrobia bacterium]|nr:sulfatase-like hydrolase/transferase [Verrucomicrobiota bacterium]